MAMLLSACLIVKDEARDLGRCLGSLRGVVDEVVVVDTGSTDHTVDVARAAGARVVSVPWTGDFAAARNCSLDAARGRWALVIDADETLEPIGASQLRAWLLASTAGAHRVVQRNLLPPGDLCGWRDDWIVRLIRNRPEHRFEGRIHEQVGRSVAAAGVRIEPLELTLVHHGYVQDLAQGGSRAARNLALLDDMVRACPGDPYLQFHRGAALMALERWADAECALQRAWRDDAGELGPDGRARCACRLAQLALRAGHEGRALRFARAALRSDPGDPVAAYVAGVAAAHLGQWETAEQWFRTVIAKPEVAGAWRTEIEALLSARGGLAPV